MPVKRCFECGTPQKLHMFKIKGTWITSCSNHEKLAYEKFGGIGDETNRGQHATSRNRRSVRRAASRGLGRPVNRKLSKRHLAKAARLLISNVVNTSIIENKELSDDVHGAIINLKETSELMKAKELDGIGLALFNESAEILGNWVNDA